MKLSEFKRVKMGQQPGDISRRSKIKMRESSEEIQIHFSKTAFQTIGEKAIKVFNAVLNKKSKKVQRRRNKDVINYELENMEKEE